MRGPKVCHLTVLLIMGFVLLPLPYRQWGASPSAGVGLDALVRSRVAVRAGDATAPGRLIEQLLALETRQGLDGGLAGEWIKVGRLFGQVGLIEAAEIVFRCVESRAREGPWRARAAFEGLELQSRRDKSVANEDWIALAILHQLPGDLFESVAKRCSRKGHSMTTESLINRVRGRQIEGQGWSVHRLRKELKGAIGSRESNRKQTSSSP